MTMQGRGGGRREYQHGTFLGEPVKSGMLAGSFETEESLEGGAIPETGGGQIRGSAEQERDNGCVKIKEDIIK